LHPRNGAAYVLCCNRRRKCKTNSLTDTHSK
jgi:hypothetical protein